MVAHEAPHQVLSRIGFSGDGGYLDEFQNCLFMDGTLDFYQLRLPTLVLQLERRFASSALLGDDTVWACF